MILLIDNYDSFTYNLAQYLGAECEVQILRNDDPNLLAKAYEAEGLVFSPGPGRPSEAGQMEELIRHFTGVKPILGICLGHQAIGEVFGGQIVTAKNIRHGKVSQMMTTQASSLFHNLPLTFSVMRYHSLSVSMLEFPEELEVLGMTTDDQEIMALKHREFPIYGLQFHPESIGTEVGQQLVTNFVRIVSLAQSKGGVSV